jgi:hypothetical protein
MFVKAKDGVVIQFPYSIHDLKKDFPNVSFPNNPPAALLKEYDVFPVIFDPLPPHDTMTFKLDRKTPVKLNGVWTVRWEVVPLDFDQAVGNIRAIRNDRLKDTDWTQGKDIPDNVSQAWGVYRQALRDVPQQEGFPFNVVWPEAPTS